MLVGTLLAQPPRLLWKVTACPSIGANVIFLSWPVFVLNIMFAASLVRLEEDSLGARCQATAHAPESVFAVLGYACRRGIRCELALKICEWIEDVRRVCAVLDEVCSYLDVCTLIFTRGTSVGCNLN